MEIISGIYMIHNKVNHKRYIGSSRNIYVRWQQHRHDLKKKEHHNRYLQAAWDKYGENKFEFVVLELCPIELLFTYEQFWYDYYFSYDRKYGYNLSPISICPVHSTKHMMKENMLVMSQDTYEQIVYELINFDTSIPKIAKKYGVHKNTVYAIYYKDEYKELTKDCVFKQRTNKGKFKKISKEILLSIINDLLQGAYDKELAVKYNLSTSTIYEIRHHHSYQSYTKGITFPSSKGRIIGKRNCKKVDQYDQKGNFIATYENARIAEKETGIGYKLISAVCHGDKRVAKGYIWRFHGESFNQYPINLK